MRAIPRPLALGLLLLTAGSAWAQGSEVPINASHRIFVGEYVAAVNARDAERFRRLVHPQSLTCITDDNRDFYDEWVARAFRRTLPDTYRLQSVRALGPNAPPMVPSRMAINPVPPTHTIQIDAQPAPYRFVTILLQVTQSAGTWLQVMPCPTAEGLAAFRAAKKANAAQDARVKALADGLPDSLRSEITALMKAGKRADAIKGYQAASGESLTVATGVVDRLEAGRPLAQAAAAGRATVLPVALARSAAARISCTSRPTSGAQRPSMGRSSRTRVRK